MAQSSPADATLALLARRLRLVCSKHRAGVGTRGRRRRLAAADSARPREADWGQIPTRALRHRHGPSGKLSLQKCKGRLSKGDLRQFLESLEKSEKRLLARVRRLTDR
jgi:hypothetical protein